MMMNYKNYKGIEYVQVSELPQNQRELLNNTLNKSLIIKILINGKIANDCLQFTDYKSWYENVFSRHTQEVTVKTALSKSTSDVDMRVANNNVFANG